MVNTSRILGPDGQPIQLAEIRAAQTAHLTSLHHEVGNHPSRGLTPSKLAQILDAAEQGDIVAQYELFEDIEEKDGHVHAEMGKRRRAVSQAKLQLGQSMRFVGQQCVQLHGGIGVTDEYIASHYFKRLTMLELAYGDTLHHLGEVSARMQDNAGVFA